MTFREPNNGLDLLQITAKLSNGNNLQVFFGGGDENIKFSIGLGLSADIWKSFGTIRVDSNNNIIYSG